MNPVSPNNTCTCWYRASQSFCYVCCLLLPRFLWSLSPPFFLLDHLSFCFALWKILLSIDKDPGIVFQWLLTTFSTYNQRRASRLSLVSVEKLYAAEFMSFQGLKKNLLIYWFSSLMYSVCCKWRLHAWGPGYGNLQYLQFYLEHCCSCLVFSWPVNILCKTRVTFT